MALTPPDQYLSAGYFLSRLVEPVRPGHRTITLGHDHSPRRFFPESWALSWCREPPERRVHDAQQFGIAEADLGRVHAWADEAFGKVFGAWDVIFRIEDARTIARMFLSKAQGLELWGLGIRRPVLESYSRGLPFRWRRPGTSQPRFRIESRRERAHAHWRRGFQPSRKRTVEHAWMVPRVGLAPTARPPHAAAPYLGSAPWYRPSVVDQPIDVSWVLRGSTRPKETRLSDAARPGP